jgi:hypothetical protein
VRDCGSGKAAASAGCMDVALMTEEDTYRDFHSAFSVSAPAAKDVTCNHACCVINSCCCGGAPGHAFWGRSDPFYVLLLVVCSCAPQVDNLQLPPGLSTHTAASIEFVGRAVRLLKSEPASAKLREMQDNWGSYNQQQLMQDQLAGLGLGMGTGMPQQLLPYGDAMAYAAALRLLQDQPEYSPGALERTVEAIRADVSSGTRGLQAQPGCSDTGYCGPSRGKPHSAFIVP